MYSGIGQKLLTEGLQFLGVNISQAVGVSGFIRNCPSTIQLEGQCTDIRQLLSAIYLRVAP